MAILFKKRSFMTEEIKMASATTTEGTGPGSAEEMRRKIENSLVREENLLPELLMPVGAVLAYGSNNAPKGWINCVGQAVSREKYADLFSVAGTTYGVGNGSTTFISDAMIPYKKNLCSLVNILL